MEKTANYQLNQWEKADRIMMEDFNRDNAKIDAALKAEEAARIAGDDALEAKLATTGASELIRSSVSSGSANAIYLSTSGVDWGRYSLVVFSIECPDALHGSFTSSAGGKFQNGGYPSWESGALMQLAGIRSASALMPVGRSGNTRVQTFGLSGNTYFGLADAPLKTVSSFSIQSPSATLKLPAGLTLSMWGVR